LRRRWGAAILASTLGIYVGTIAIGVRIRNLSLSLNAPETKNWMAWEPPLQSSIPHNPRDDSIRYGELLFDETPIYASKYAKANISCTSCHVDGGIQPYASPMVGLPSLFPMYNQRAGRIISLRDRIQECFVRSENGTPLSYQSREMQSLVDYITWLSEPQPERKLFVGRGLIRLPELRLAPKHGVEIYMAQCAGCHGQDGEGRAPQFPPLWGPQSFNDGAGMNNVSKMAAFVQHNMPDNRMGILSAQDAFDVSAFIHAQPRPAFNLAYKSF
jgi:thiosulfate dehydrogenase